MCVIYIQAYKANSCCDLAWTNYILMRNYVLIVHTGENFPHNWRFHNVRGLDLGEKMAHSLILNSGI